MPDATYVNERPCDEKSGAAKLSHAFAAAIPIPPTDVATTAVAAVESLGISMFGYAHMLDSMQTAASK
jgi:hypothetical protein